MPLRFRQLSHPLDRFSARCISGSRGIYSATTPGELEIHSITAIPGNLLALFFGASVTVSLVNSSLDTTVAFMSAPVMCTNQAKRAMMITLPPLPRLKSVQFTLEYEWMMPVYYRFSAILIAAPDTPEEICIRFAPRPHFLHQEALGRMDTVLTGSAQPMLLK
ncbi:hypothetical protein B0H19DRAFT_1268357 [Mycena capillaripes]|nr:hypothetical protein B0H19DRAFT_1268357 [Mycena capillaripes]